jgi:FkbM family methyltransferase
MIVHPPVPDVLDIQIGQNKYGKYAVPANTSDRPCSQAILRGNVYEPDTIQFMIDNHGGKSIVTAGLFFGDFLPALLQNCTASVYGFEPHQVNYRCALMTATLNFDPSKVRVHLHNCALGQQSEQVSLMQHSANGVFFGGGCKIVNNKDHGTTSVFTKRGDDVISDTSNIGIVQLDVEDYEEQALKGMSAILKKSSPILILECWNDTMFDTEFFEKEIFGNGYTMQGKLHDNVVLSK